MSWAYRVVRNDEGFAVYEIHFDEAGRPIALAARAETAVTDTVQELREELELLLEALSSPALQRDEIGQENEEEQVDMVAARTLRQVSRGAGRFAFTWKSAEKSFTLQTDDNTVTMHSPLSPLAVLSDIESTLNLIGVTERVEQLSVDVAFRAVKVS